MKSKTVRYRFARYGRSPHLIIESAEDLHKILDLDPALWVVTSAPVSCINVDARTVAYIDADDNGRITRTEVAEAVRWLLDVLATLEPVNAGSDRIYSGDVNLQGADAGLITGAIEKILARGGQDGARASSSRGDGSVDLATVQRIISEIESRPTSGSGVVSRAAAPDSTTANLLKAIVDVTGGVPHPDGSAGVDAGSISRFNEAAASYHAWSSSSPPDLEYVDTHVFDTVFDRIVPRIDRYFDLCTLAAALPDNRLTPADIIQETGGGIADSVPLAAPSPGGVLRPESCTNARYADDLSRFFDGIIAPLDNGSAAGLDARSWARLRARINGLETWKKSKPALADKVAAVTGLDEVSSPEILDRLAKLVDAAKSAALDLKNVKLLEKLILYQKHILNLVNNFVSFPYLFSRTERAAFERGFLIMDGRSFHLAVTVRDRAKHVQIAKNSSMFVMYAEVKGSADQPGFEVAIPVTAGRKGNLVVGKRGVFVDLEGVERDAEIREIIENPISIAEAVISPFRRIGRMITGKIEAITQEAQQQLDSFASGNVGAFTSAEKPASGGLSGGGLLLGGSVAFAAIGSAIAYITNTLTRLSWWQFLAGLGGAVALVIVPATVLAFIKLRRRDVSAIIEASGWAVNARMRLTHRLSGAFTRRPNYPKGSKGVPVHRRR